MGEKVNIFIAGCIAVLFGSAAYAQDDSTQANIDKLYDDMMAQQKLANDQQQKIADLVKAIGVARAKMLALCGKNIIRIIQKKLH